VGLSFDDGGHYFFNVLTIQWCWARFLVRALVIAAHRSFYYIVLYARTILYFRFAISVLFFLSMTAPLMSKKSEDK